MTPTSPPSPKSVSGAEYSDGDITLNANADYVVFDTEGYGGLSMAVSGTFTGTIKVQWSSKAAGPWSDATGTLNGAVAATLTAGGQATYTIRGRYVKIVVTAWTSGTATLTPMLHDDGFAEGAGGGGGGDATDASLVTLQGLIGALNDAASAGDGSLSAVLKYMRNVQGDVDDAAWGGSGDGTGVSVWKAIYAKLTELASSTSSSPVHASGREYETIAVSQTDAICGATGAIGDELDTVWLFPADASLAGAVTIKDDATSVFVYPAGATPTATAHPIAIPLNLTALGAGWKITTPSDCTVLAIGNFT